MRAKDPPKHSMNQDACPDEVGVAMTGIACAPSLVITVVTLNQYRNSQVGLHLQKCNKMPQSGQVPLQRHNVFNPYFVFKIYLGGGQL